MDPRTQLSPLDPGGAGDLRKGVARNRRVDLVILNEETAAAEEPGSRLPAAGATGTRSTMPAGRAFEFKPGGYHVMLQELKAPVLAGSTVPVTLHLRGASGADSRLELQVPVLAQAPAGAAAHHSHHKH